MSFRIENDPSTITKRHKVLHAKRLISGTDYFDTLAFSGWRLGGNCLDFYGPGRLSITLVGSGEVFKMGKDSYQLREASIGRAIKRAKERMPTSFHEPLPIQLGALSVMRYAEDNRQTYRTLVADVLDPPAAFEAERRAVLDGLDIEAGRRHPWLPKRSVVKLAAIVNISLFNPALLEELPEHLPTDLIALGGTIKPHTLETIA